MCGDGCGCGIGMEIRYPYWAHIAMVVSRPRRKRVCRSAGTCSCGPVGSQQNGLPGWLRWTGPRGVFGARQYGLPGLLGWTGFDGSDGVPLHGPRCLVGYQQHGLPGLLLSTGPRGLVGAQQYRLLGFLSSTGPRGLLSALQYGPPELRRWSVFGGSDGVPLHGTSSSVYVCGCGFVCGDGCGCGIGMEIRYPYWAHSATGSRDPSENAHGARPALAARPALCSNAYLDCCTGPALAAWSEPGSTNYRGAGPACRAGAQVRTTFCCAGLALAARRCDSFLPCSLLPTGLQLAGEDWKGPGLLLRLSALAAALAPLPTLCPAWGWLLTLGGLLGRDSSPQNLSHFSHLSPPSSPSSSLASPCLSMRGQAMLCPCPPRTI